MMEEVQSIFSVWLMELLRFNVEKKDGKLTSYPLSLFLMRKKAHVRPGLPWTDLNGLLTESGSGQKALQKL